MLAEAQWLATITLMVGIAGVLFGARVYRRQSKLRAVKAFLLMTFLFLLAAITNFALIISPDAGTALTTARLMMITLTLLYGSMLYLSSLLPLEYPSGWFDGRERGLALVTVLFAVGSWFSAEKVTEDNLGWAILPTPVTMLWVGAILACVAIAAYMMTRVCLASGDRAIRSQLTAMSVAVVFPALYTIIIGTVEIAGFDLPHVTSFGFLVTLGMFVYGVSRAKLFAPVPRNQPLPPSAEAPVPLGIPRAEFLLYEGKDSDTAYRRFVAETQQGRDGLIISRTYPERVKEQYAVGNMPVVWLASHPGPNRIDPSNLSILQHTVAEFLRRGNDAVVLIDGLEYLVANNPMDRVLRALYSIKDEVIMSHSKLVVPFDPEVLEDQQLALIEREFEVIRVGEEGAGTGI
jgi:hypothetical protein